MTTAFGSNDFRKRIVSLIEGKRLPLSMQHFLITIMPQLPHEQSEIQGGGETREDDDSDSSEEGTSVEHSHSSSSTRSSNASLVSVQSSTQMTVFNPFAQPPREGNSGTFFQRVLPRLGGFEGDVGDISDLLSFNFDTLERCSEIVKIILQESLEALNKWRDSITDLESLYIALEKLNRAKEIVYMLIDSDKSNLAAAKSKTYKNNAQKCREEKNRKIYKKLRKQTFVVLDDTLKLISWFNTWKSQFKPKETKTSSKGKYRDSLITYLKNITIPNDVLPIIQNENNMKSILGGVTTIYVVVNAIDEALDRIPKAQVGNLDVYAFGLLLQIILQDLRRIPNKKVILVGEHISRPDLKIKDGKLNDDDLAAYFTCLENFSFEKMMELLFGVLNEQNQSVLLSAIKNENFVEANNLPNPQNININQPILNGEKIIPLDVLSSVNNFVFPETFPDAVLKALKNGVHNTLAFFGH